MHILSKIKKLLIRAVFLFSTTKIKYFISHRPLIVITFFYILVIIIINQFGYFSPEKRSKLIPYLDKENTRVTAKITDLPEIKDNFIRFTVQTRSVNDNSIKEKILVYHYYPIEEFEPGDIVNITGKIRKPFSSDNPGVFNYSDYLSRQNIYSQLFVSAIKKIGHSSLPVYKSIALNFRKSVINSIKSSLPKKESSILLPMLIGDKSGLSKETKSSFINAGVMHILVVSGLHVAFCAAIFLGIFRLTGLSRRKSALFTIPFIVLYVLATGSNPPAVRAGIMAIFVIISLSLAREPKIYHSLALAALTILLFDPQSLFTVSFQLSFAATLGIVYLYPYFIIIFKYFPKWLKYSFGSLFSVSLSAQLSVLPLLAIYFNKISVIGLIGNLVIVPFVGIIISLGMLIYVFNLFLTQAANFMSIVCMYFLNVIVYFVEFLSKIPNSTFHIATPSLLNILMYYFMLWAIFKIRKIPKLVYPLLISLLIIGSVNATNAYILNKNLEITFLSVGDSSSAHIHFPDGNNWLIDTGGSYETNKKAGEYIIYPYLKSKGIQRLEKIFITKASPTHYGGLKTILDNFTVNEIIFNPNVSGDRELIDLYKVISENNVTLNEAWAKDYFTTQNSTLTVLSPSSFNANDDDNCLVMILDHKGKKVLFTSDMSRYTENDMFKFKSFLRSDILQLPKGGRRKLSQKFINLVKPTYLISSTTITNKYKVKVFSTQRDGAIIVSIDSNNINIKSFN